MPMAGMTWAVGPQDPTCVSRLAPSVGLGAKTTVLGMLPAAILREARMGGLKRMVLGVPSEPWPLFACEGHVGYTAWPRGHPIVATQGAASRSITTRRRIPVLQKIHRNFILPPPGFHPRVRLSLSNETIMNPSHLFQLGRNPWTSGLLLALLNAALAVFSVASFMGVLFVVSWLNQLRLADHSASSELPFPYPALMLLDAMLFLVAWIWFGRRLPNVGRERFITALVGAAPLFGLSLLGYAGVLGGLVFEQVSPGRIPVGSFFVFGGIATLILFAGMTCVGLISGVRGSAIKS